MLLRNALDSGNNPGKLFGGSIAQTRQTFLRPGSYRWRFTSESGGQDPKTAYPVGYLNPYTWSLPQQGGGMSSHNNTDITVGSAAVLVGGKPISGSSDITFTTTATGGLIVSGSGSASITLSPTGTLISVAAGSGSATVTLSGTALIGALAGISGQTSITLSPTAAIRAVGFLSGLASNETEFSPDALARAVWDATASSFDLAGTMGEKLNSAGTSGDPWTADLSGYAAGTAGNQLNSKVLTLSKYVGLK
jgi:hypothetical protein